MLTVTVTHLKEGYLRRNGLPRSDKATLTEHWIRNGDFLTVMTIVNRSGLPDRAVRAHDRLRARSAAAGAAVSVRRGAGSRSQERRDPEFSAGHQSVHQEFATRHELPVEATRGGADTMYPDFLEKGRTQPIVPPTAPAAASSPPGIQILPVRGNVYMLLGAGGNITVSVGRDGVLMVDAGRAR